MLYRWDQIDLDYLMDRSGLVKGKQGKRKGYKEKQYFNCVCAFDIETTTINFPLEEGQTVNSHSFMYIWQMQLGDYYTVIGRSWDEFDNLMRRIRDSAGSYAERHNLDEKPYLCFFVHNLAYEFQFISGIYNFRSDECFFRDMRKPIYCCMYESIEFRCSYIQTNMSLGKFTEQMGCSVQKQSGQEFDYKVIRYPWSELSEKEIEYCIDDVISLVEAMTIKMTRDGDTIKSIPLTSTGYVRRDCKQAIRPVHKTVDAMKPDEQCYRLLRKAFRGGNTHANKDYVGKIYKGVESYDMTSCYPAQQLTKKFPMKPFKKLSYPITIQRCLNFACLGYAVVGTYQFRNLCIKDPHEAIPYLSFSKCDVYDGLNRKVKNPKDKSIEIDNGRILSAYYLETTLTEIDLKIVIDTYSYDEIGVIDAMVAQKDYLPESYRKVIKDYYDKKTILKGCESEEEQYLYMKSKNLLNGIYGMTAQDPVHQQIDYINGKYVVSDYDSEKTAERLQKANFPYQWGVYTTAYAREALQAGLKLAGHDVIYCDTDSIKTIRPVDFTRLNASLQKKATSAGAYADDRNGGRHYVGVYEQDAVYDGGFITQGAKRYAYIKHGKMGVTVSGVTHKVNEETGKEYAVEELKKLERFKPGMIWRKAGGTMAVYNDRDDFYHYVEDQGELKRIHFTKNVAIVDSTYEMEYSKDYDRILKIIELYGVWKKRDE